MLPKVVWLQTDEATARQRSAARASLTQEIRKLCDGLGSEHLRLSVSAAAARAAESLGVDLCQQTWGSQLRFDPGRRVFHLEHVVPVATVREHVLASRSVSQVEDALSMLRLAWILKSENTELERLGYRSIRKDPDHAYVHAGIEITACQHGRAGGLQPIIADHLDLA